MSNNKIMVRCVYCNQVLGSNQFYYVSDAYTGKCRKCSTLISSIRQSMYCKEEQMAKVEGTRRFTVYLEEDELKRAVQLAKEEYSEMIDEDPDLIGPSMLIRVLLSKFILEHEEYKKLWA